MIYRHIVPKSILLNIVLFVGIMLCSFGVNAQSNYYVSTTGSNSNNGSQLTPWQTIQYSLGKVATGDTLNILTGVYPEKLKIPTSGITIRNGISSTPIIDAAGITSQVSIIDITDVSNTIIDGIELRNNIMLDAQGILVDGNCQNITIKNCKIHDIHFSSNASASVNSNTNAQGIIVYGSNATTPISNLKILNNQLYNCRLGYSEGIAVNGNVSGFEVSGNSVHDLTNIGIDLIGFEGTSSNTANDQARNGIIRNNIVHHCVSAYATSGGLYVDGGNSILIENNISYHNGYGIEIGCENAGKVTNAITVQNNIFYDNEVCAVALGGWNYPKSGKVINSSFRNNTCYYDDYSKSGNGEIYLSYSEGCTIENNIFYTTTDNNLVYAELSQPSLSFNYNVIYCSSGATNLSAGWNKKSYSTYAAFVAGTGTNINSVFANPLFVLPNITNPDFHITNLSPAINAGDPAFIPATDNVDIDGQSRKNGIIDCGADEYYLLNGVNDIEIRNHFKIYPSPTQNDLIIQNVDLELNRIIVYDNSGKETGEYSVEDKPEIKLNFFGSTRGVYSLVGFNKNMKPITSQKFILK
jgi:hypothetical protein